MERLNRRTFLKGSGVGLVSTVAGCTSNPSGDTTPTDGGDSDDTPTQDVDAPKETLTIVTNESESSAFAMSQGLASLVNQNSDSLKLQANPGKGLAANVGQLSRDDVQIALLDSYSAALLDQGKGDFADLDINARKMQNYYTVGYSFVSRKDSGITTYSDITDDTTIMLGASATRTRTYRKLAIQKATDADFNVKTFGYADQAGALGEGRIDMGMIGLVNVGGTFALPSWSQQIITQNDVNVVDFSDEAVANLNDDPTFAIASWDPSTADLEGLEAPDGKEEVDILANLQWLMTREDVPKKHIKELLRVEWNNREELTGYHAFLTNFKNDEWFVNGHDDFQQPFHSGSEEFFQDKGILP